MSEPWYAEGLRFRCTACGDCCTGEPGAVWVNDEEIAAIAAYLELSPDAFIERYVRRYGTRKSLFERFNGDCVLFDPETRRCTVYPVRPVQCRTWPFWEDNVATPEAWGNTCAVCPGSGEGPLHSVESIRHQLALRREARKKR